MAIPCPSRRSLLRSLLPLVIAGLIAGAGILRVPPIHAQEGEEGVDGALDLRFGDGGTVTTAFADPATLEGIALQPDGKIVAAGYLSTQQGTASVMALARYGVDGTLDRSFGTDGLVTTDFPGRFTNDAQAHAIAVQADGRIVVVGNAWFTSVSDAAMEFAIARYLPDGTLDPSFGTGGRVLVPGRFDVVWAVAIQPDRKIVIGGGYQDSLFKLFKVARLNSDGSSDATFVGERTDFGTFPNRLVLAVAHSLVVQRDGAIVLAGTAQMVSPTFGVVTGAMARYLPDGTLDPSFGGTGKIVTTDGGHASGLLSVMQQADGRLVTVGQRDGALTLARFNGNGQLDTRFGSAGRVITSIPVSDARGVFALDGKLITTAAHSSENAMYRYSKNGVADPTFGDVGHVVTSVEPRTVIVQPDGKVVVGANRTNPITGLQEFALARYTTMPAGAFGGTVHPIPGRIEAEDYDVGGPGVSYGDAALGNEGGAYRTDDVDIKPSREGGMTVGWMMAGEWLGYSVNVRRPGFYTVTARIGSALAGRTIHIEMDGVDVTGPIEAPLAGDWDQYGNVDIPDVWLHSGRQLMRVVVGTEHWVDLQWVRFSAQP